MNPSNHPTTPLASSQVNGDPLRIELVEPANAPAFVAITWPTAATIIDPKRFGDTARDVAQLFARGHIVLASLKAGGHL